MESDQKKVSVTEEAAYIRARAQARESRIVTVGKLMLFSTSTGDAWLLDTTDKRALLLVDEGEVDEDIEIRETDQSTVIRWAGRYRIDGLKFLFIADEVADIRSYMGYPVQQIAKHGGSGGQAVTSKERDARDMLHRMLRDTGRE